MSQLKDCEIEEVIERVLVDDPRVDPGEIDVRVMNGVVYLSGIVDSAAERHAAEDDIRSAVEVAGVVDQLTLRNFIERTDDELRETVRHGLMRDSDVDINSIKVEAKSGVVTLSGHVPDPGLKSAVEQVAWWTPGVTDVVSHLEAEAEVELETNRAEVDDY